MEHDVVLPVAHEPQLHFFTCGPACINMVLSRWGKSRPQLQVWQDVQDNTSGPRPADAPADAGSFPNQYCDRCSDNVITMPDGTTHGDYACWYTTPEAMAATINATSPVPVTADYIADGRDAIRRVADSLATFDVPAVFTSVPALHWMVAYGYRYDDTQPTASSSVKWKNQFITGIFVHNPSPLSAPSGGTSRIQMLTPRGLDDLLMSIACGTRLDEHPVVGGAEKKGGGSGGGGDSTGGGPGGGNAGADAVIGPWGTFLAAVFLWLDPRRWLRYFLRGRRPGPPPRWSR